MSNEINKIDTSSKIGQGIKLSTPLINASGCLCTTKSEIDILNSVQNLGAIVTKTCTLKERNGNPKPRYWSDNIHTINSMGLPNKGINYYIDYIVSSRCIDSVYYLRKEQINKGKSLESECIAERNIDDSFNPKPIIISIGGLSLKENMNIIKEYIDFNNAATLITPIHIKHGQRNPLMDKTVIDNNICVNGLEFNLSCPNIEGKGQLGYDFEQFDNYLSSIFESDLTFINKDNLSIGLKLPPYFELTHFGIVKDILTKYPRLDYITTINSIANGLVIDVDTESPVIAPKNGLGGIGGNYILPTALSNVYNFNKELNGKLDIVGCGGIISGRDVFRHILCGASCIAVGSLLQDYGIQVISKLYDELTELMKFKNYNSLDDFRGKLKQL